MTSRQKSVIGEKALNAIPVRAPRLPYYMRGSFTELHRFADSLADEDTRSWLGDEDYTTIADILRRLASSEEARALIFLRGRKKQGGQARRIDRDYLVAMEYWLMRELHRDKRGQELADLKTTADHWREWQITEAIVKSVRTKYKQQCQKEIHFHLDRLGKGRHGHSHQEIAHALLRGVSLAKRTVWKRELKG